MQEYRALTANSVPMSVPVQSSQPFSPAQIDFGWIKQGWTLFAAQSGVWVGALLLSFLISVAVFVLLAIPTGLFDGLRSTYDLVYLHKQAPPSPVPNPTWEFAKGQAFGILIGGIAMILTGGLYRMALRQARGEPISVFGVFSAFPQSLPLFLLGSVVPIVSGVAEGIVKWPLHRLLPPLSQTVTNNLSFLLSTLLNGLLMFAPFLVLDARAGVAEALLGSVRLLRGQVARGIWFYVAVSILGALGLFGCGVGMLATYPIFLFSVTLAYLALTNTAVPVPEFAPAPAGVWPPPPSFPASPISPSNGVVPGVSISPDERIEK